MTEGDILNHDVIKKSAFLEFKISTPNGKTRKIEIEREDCRVFDLRFYDNVIDVTYGAYGLSLTRYIGHLVDRTTVEITGYDPEMSYELKLLYRTATGYQQVPPQEDPCTSQA